MRLFFHNFSFFLFLVPLVHRLLQHREETVNIPQPVNLIITILCVIVVQRGAACVLFAFAFGL